MRRVPFVREIAGWGGAAMITIALVMLSPSKVFPGWWALLPTLGTVLIIMAGMVAAFNRHVLAWRPFVFIGLISYPLYLWHWPLLSFAWQAFFNDPPRWVSDVLVGLSFLLAWLTYKLLERPIRMSRIARPAVALVMVAVVIGGVGYAIDLGGGLPWRAANATGYVRSDFNSTFLIVKTVVRARRRRFGFCQSVPVLTRRSCAHRRRRRQSCRGAVSGPGLCHAGPQHRVSGNLLLSLGRVDRIEQAVQRLLPGTNQ